MLFTQLTSLLVLLSGSSALAAPNPIPAPARLEKRAAEVVYIANCTHTATTSAFGTKKIYVNEFAYYADTNLSQNGQQPGAVAVIASNPDNYAVNQGRHRVGAFPDGVIFEATLNNGSDHLAVTQYSGWGNNGYASFACYRDNNRHLYTKNVGQAQHVCRARYYCMK